jgi:ABC-2 type transport system permease protein
MTKAQKDFDQENNKATAAEATGREDPGHGERMNPLIELTRTRIREFVREPEAVFWVFVFPVLLAVVLGIAFRNTAPEENRIAVVSAASSDAADNLARTLSESPDVEALRLSPDEAAQALRTGKVSLVVVTSGDAAAASSFDYQYDPTRPESRVARLAVNDALQRALGRADVAPVRDQTSTEPGARYIDWLVPGIIGMNLMGSGMWGLGFAVVYARTRKLLKRFAATPMRRSHYLLSFMLSRLIFLTGEVAAVIIFAYFAFGVEVRGSIFSLALISLLGAMMFAGLGLLVAARPKTIEGVSGLMNLAMVPMWLMSGVFFSSSRFPEPLQPLIQALPLTALNDSLRAVISEGAPLASSWMDIGIMMAWGVVSFALAMKLFRWQ